MKIFAIVIMHLGVLAVAFPSPTKPRDADDLTSVSSFKSSNYHIRCIIHELTTDIIVRRPGNQRNRARRGQREPRQQYLHLSLRR